MTDSSGATVSGGSQLNLRSLSSWFWSDHQDVKEYWCLNRTRIWWSIDESSSLWHITSFPMERWMGYEIDLVGLANRLYCSKILTKKISGPVKKLMGQKQIVQIHQRTNLLCMYGNSMHVGWLSNNIGKWLKSPRQKAMVKEAILASFLWREKRFEKGCHLFTHLW